MHAILAAFSGAHEYLALFVLAAVEGMGIPRGFDDLNRRGA